MTLRPRTDSLGWGLVLCLGTACSASANASKSEESGVGADTTFGTTAATSSADKAPSAVSNSTTGVGGGGTGGKASEVGAADSGGEAGVEGVADAGYAGDAGTLGDSGSTNGSAGGDVGPTYFVAVGGSGRRSATTDGLDWSIDVGGNPAVSLLRGVAWGNGTFVAVGDCDTGGCALSSRDAKEWSITGRFTSFASSAAYHDGVWVTAGGNGERFRSEDEAASWQSTGAFVDGHFRDITSGPSGFVVVGHRYDGSNEGMIAISQDGADWEMPEVGGAALYAVTYAADRYVAVGAAGRVSTSLDAVQWHTQSLGNVDLSDVAFGNGVFIAVGGGQGYYSSDALSFQTTPGYAPDHLVFGDGLFVGVGDSRRFVSSDGLDWGEPTQTGGDGYSDVTFGRTAVR